MQILLVQLNIEEPAMHPLQGVPMLQESTPELHA